MSFQWIVNNCVDVKINRLGIVGQTVARDQTVRAVNRGGTVWKFSVTPCPGQRWQDSGVKTNIETIQTQNKFTQTTINFNSPGHAYLTGIYNVTFNVICTNLPDYTITPTGIVQWNGNFEFMQVTT